MLDTLIRFIFGSCVSVVEAASDLIPESWQKSTSSSQPERKKQRYVDPRLAGLAGRYRSKSINPQDHIGGFPSFLEGESVDYSTAEDHTVFDDNISALSAYTLEEMARMNALMASKPQLLKTRLGFIAPPPVARTSSSSSSSRDGKTYHPHNVPTYELGGSSGRKSKGERSNR